MSLILSQMPKMHFKSNARPSQYGYIPHIEKEKEKERGKVIANNQYTKYGVL